MSSHHPLAQLILFRIRGFLREPAALFWVFVFPVLAMGALGLAFRPGEPGPVTVGVLGGDAVRVLRGDEDGEAFVGIVTIGAVTLVRSLRSLTMPPCAWRGW